MTSLEPSQDLDTVCESSGGEALIFQEVWHIDSWDGCPYDGGVAPGELHLEHYWEFWATHLSGSGKIRGDQATDWLISPGHDDTKDGSGGLRLEAKLYCMTESDYVEWLGYSGADADCIDWDDNGMPTVYCGELGDTLDEYFGPAVEQNTAWLLYEWGDCCGNTPAPTVITNSWGFTR